MYKIIYIIDGLTNGGKERQLIETCKHINKKKYWIGIISFSKGQHYENDAKLLCNDYTFINKENNKLSPFRVLYKYFKKINPDIVHSWDSFSSFYIFFLRKVFPFKYVDGSIRDAGIEKGFRYFLKRVFLKNADAIIANSNAGLSYYKVKGFVIYNIINASRFKSFLQITEFNIIKASTFSDYKDHKSFILAAYELLKQNIVDNVFLPGSGKNRKKYITMVNSYENKIAEKFHFPDDVHNIENYYGKCKIGVLYSTTDFQEGLSNSLLEYMAAGLVPISTAIGGSLEVIKPKVNGFLLPPGDTKEIISIIKEIKENILLRETITKNAKKFILENCHVKINLEKTLKIYQNLLNNND